MPMLKRLLDKQATGPVLNDEDWWRLAYDSDTGRLFVEHEWEHVDVSRDGKANSGVTQTDVTSFLSEGGQGAAHRELRRLLFGLFEGGQDA